jgi:predicted O-linked N-acetylglucosamine transferase (SPINDLY family)
MESLWQGVPVLCFRGDRWASRISESIVRSAGLPEFVAADADGFRELAVRLANDSNTPALLARVRSGMRDHLRAWPICDVERFARNMEDVYQSICKW